MSENQTIPYSHHYRCFPQMIGSVANQAVFMYLMDEYVCRLKTGKPTTFNISINEIAQKRNMTWRTVSKSLESISTMKLISIQDNICLVNSNLFIGLIQAFYNLSDTNSKEQFIAALSAGDYDTLKDLGLKETSDGDAELLSQNGILANDLGGSAKKQKVLLNDRRFCQKAEEGSAKKQKVLLKSRSILSNIKQTIQQNYSKHEFTEVLEEYFMEFFNEEELENFVCWIFEQENDENVIFNAELFFLLTSGVLSFSRSGFCHLAEGVLSFSRTVNKEININKDHYEDENSKEENEAEMKTENKTEEDENFQVDPSLMGNALSGYKQEKKRMLLPFFPAKEIEEYVSDIRNCLDRADKIYINQVWEISHELYDMDAIYDDDGTEIAPASDNIENVGVPEERLMNDILLPAFDRTQEIIEAGKIEVNGEEHNITATIESPEDFENIIDWETVVLPDGINYIISSRRVRNIFGEQVMKVSGRPTREECADSMEYMKRIVKLGDDDDRYAQLTPIELAIYNFLGDHFIIDDSGTVVEPKYRNIGCTDLRLCYHELKQKGLSKDDFISVLSVDKPDMHECLNLRPCMFRAGKIRQWNQLHSYSSVIDSLES